MKKIILIITAFICTSKSVTAQLNGYSLEFEDVITLSVDSLTYPGNGMYTKSFTVPTGTVLKINSGRITSYQLNSLSGKYFTGFIKINDNLIIARDSTARTNLAQSFLEIFRITPESPIWAPSNATVTIGVEVSTPLSSNPTFLGSNWISGVLFRKVPN